jgi:hypothetical protein
MIVVIDAPASIVVKIEQIVTITATIEQREPLLLVA